MGEKRWPDDKLFRFHWRFREPQEGYGRDAADAFMRLGYGGGAYRALQDYECVEGPTPSKASDHG